MKIPIVQQPLRGGAATALAASLLTLAVPPQPANAAPSPRYAFESGRKYVYEVKITATFEDALETREGLSIYAVKSAAADEFVLNHSGSLSTQRKATGARTPWSRPDFLRHFPWPEHLAVRAGNLTLTGRGRVIKAEAETALPYMLGDLEYLVIEEFPADSKSRWETKRDVTITQRERSMFPRGPFAPAAEAGPRRAAQETVKFQVLGKPGPSTRLKRDYLLQSDEKTDGAPRLELSGTGELVFDTRQGAMESVALKYTYRLNETNLSYKIPITVDCRLLSREEGDKRLKAREEAQAAAQAAAAKANEPKALDPGEKDKLLADLKSRDEWTVRRAADRLARAPADDQPGPVASALEPLLADRSGWIRAAAAKALVNWATAQSGPALVKAVADTDLWVRKAAMEAVARVKPAEGAQAVAGRLVHMQDRGDAAKALKSMGAAAEPAVLTCLQDRDGWVQLEACKILGAIGTAKSLPALDEYGRSGKPFSKDEADKATKAIKARP